MTRTIPLARLDDVNPPVFRVTGRTPWRVAPCGKYTVAILDADDNTLVVCLPEIAGRIVGAVNLVEQAYEADVSGYRKVDEQS